MCDGSDGYYDVEDGDWRTARKRHECCACSETISPGHRYHVHSGLFDGAWERHKHCARCWTMLEAIVARATDPVRMDLGCGLRWEDSFGDLPDHVAALAFALPGEAAPRRRDGGGA